MQERGYTERHQNVFLTRINVFYKYFLDRAVQLDENVTDMILDVIQTHNAAQFNVYLNNALIAVERKGSVAEL